MRFTNSMFDEVPFELPSHQSTEEVGGPQKPGKSFSCIFLDYKEIKLM